MFAISTSILGIKKIDCLNLKHQLYEISFCTFFKQLFYILHLFFYMNFYLKKITYRTISQSLSVQVIFCPKVLPFKKFAARMIYFYNARKV